MSSLAKALSPAVRELRFLCCQSGSGSTGIRRVKTFTLVDHHNLIMHIGDRQFIQSTYPSLKKSNPDLPILIREANGTPARAFARFGVSQLYPHNCVLTDVSINVTTEYGVEKHVELDNLNAKEVEQKIAQLLSV